jgi:hypothetical protein
MIDSNAVKVIMMDMIKNDSVIEQGTFEHKGIKFKFKIERE